ncbi:SitI3 family protein [Plantactinospora solaniradicis]|uniref:SitI3 family protein n=1 Tax=Plantactinospora solaniradicis TaxID=1723736 RepID=A0ABW1KBV8_9ACTN
MAIEYRLTLAGDIPLEQVAALAAPNATEASSPAGNRLLSVNLDEERGYSVSITSGRHGYYDAEDDGGAAWEWKPDKYVDVNFRMRKNDPSGKGTPNMVSAVGKVLAGRPEDAALVLDGNYLLLTRVNGILRKHNLATWYDEDYDNILPE